MNLQNYVITADTDQALIPFIRAYQNPGRAPSRQELMETEYETKFYHVDGHLSLVGLADDVGIDAMSYIDQIQEAEIMMKRAMDEDL